ncbi:MAG: dihydroorotate dehydrogenase electron transfer subunit [Rikenellaceae bacterium]
MYKRGIYKIESNEALTDSVYRMRLSGDTKYITAPGQFVNIALAGSYLRRPISVSDYDDSSLTIIYKVVGGGTQKMSQMGEGAELDLLTGLGNGFNVDAECKEPILVGGGVGVPPLYNLCKKLLAIGKRPTVILGFNKASELFLLNEFEALGAKVIATTVDGSYGIKGFVTSALDNISYDYVYSCGPLPMLKALYDATEGVAGEYSFEERMGCGFGACVGCTCKTKYGNKRVCKDGPVLVREEIIW